MGRHVKWNKIKWHNIDLPAYINVVTRYQWRTFDIEDASAMKFIFNAHRIQNDVTLKSLLVPDDSYKKPIIGEMVYSLKEGIKPDPELIAALLVESIRFEAAYRTTNAKNKHLLRHASKLDNQEERNVYDNNLIQVCEEAMKIFNPHGYVRAKVRYLARVSEQNLNLVTNDELTVEELVYCQKEKFGNLLDKSVTVEKDGIIYLLDVLPTERANKG